MPSSNAYHPAEDKRLDQRPLLVNPTGPALILTPAAWATFADSIKNGAFD
ncbi:DUF397 domain-containing protein [Streptosporangium sp. NPDC002544]